MAKPDKEGNSERDFIRARLEKARERKDHKTIARCLKRLTGPVLPVAGHHVLVWFSELSNSRSVGMAANPISFLEIEAWSRLRGVRPNRWELRLLLSLDAAWRTVQAEEKSEAPVTADGEVDHELVAEKLRAQLGF